MRSRFRMNPAQIARGSDINRLWDAIEAIHEVKAGPGLRSVVSGGGTYIMLSPDALNGAKGKGKSSQQTGLTALSQITAIFIARITAATPQMGVIDQWQYSWKSVASVINGPVSADNFADASNQVTGTAACNLLELLNIEPNMAVDGITTGSQLGNGINPGNIPNGFTLQPCPVGALVIMYGVTTSDGGTAFYFAYENAIDGSCV